MKNGSQIAQFIKKHRDRAALIGLLVGLIVFIGVGISLQKSDRKPAGEAEPLVDPNKVELKLENTKSNVAPQKSQKGTAAFFLKPSPSELLEDLKTMDDLNENVVQARFTGLRVLWPVYFFSLEEKSGKKIGRAKLLADVSEDGFGVMINADVPLRDYSQLNEIEQGEKIWIGGEILAVDPEGTGVIYILAEHISVGEKPLSVPELPAESSD